MKIGVDYYPEQWDKGLWEQDVEDMKDAGVEIVRMAEFAWSRLEPEEGIYCFEWLDEIVGIFAERQIQVLLSTPTCTPPLWLFEKYPEVIQVDKSGRRIPIGIRGHRCLNSPVYREKCEKIIRQMVSRYAGNEWVIGYQIDNELESSHCCCPVCEEKFRAFIKNKYGTIGQLNKAYGNSVWSGEYSSFSQIKPPLGEHQTWLNPSYMLDFNRFASESTVEYVTFQRELIHSLDEKALVTTNTWLCENMPDFYKMFEKLDFVAFDNYPATKLPDDSETLYSHAFHLDLMRGIKKKNFWIMEELSGSLGSWTPMQPTLPPGMLEGYSLQAIAHGADAVLHFRWRTAVSGAEMFWHGLIDHSNVKGRRYREFCSLCQTVKEWKEIEGSVVRNRVAILYSSEQEYGFKIQPQAEGMHYFTQIKAYHDAFTCLGIGIDVVEWLSDLSGYDLVAAPALFITNKRIEENLKEYVKCGGTLVLTSRSGVKDEYNRCIMSPLPTVFSELTGSTVKEYNPLGLKTQKIEVSDKIWKGKPFTCTLWCDILEPNQAEVLARYGEDFYQGEAAVTANHYGNGKVYYVGTVLNRKGMADLTEFIVKDLGMEYIQGLPAGVERTVRQKEAERFVFLFNNTEKKQDFVFQRIQAGKQPLSERAILEPFEMAIVKDNMTLFDNTGKAMKSLHVFNDISSRSGMTSSGNVRSNVNAGS